MRDTDFPKFVELLDAVCALLSRGQYTPSEANSALWFRSLAAYDLDTVRAGFDAHVRDPKHGRFVPTPADIFNQIEGRNADDGRPGADEAWAMAIRAADENATVVWTEEMAGAWGVVRELYQSDDVGARVAFRDAYNRLLDAARKRRAPAKWVASLGFDQSARAVAIYEAIKLNRLPAPGRELLNGPKADGDPVPLALLSALRERLTTPAPEVSSHDAIAKTDTHRRQAEAAKRVDAYRGSLQ